MYGYKNGRPCGSAASVPHLSFSTAKIRHFRETAKKITKKLAGNKFITYICSMRKELGKWLMDIAKYITKAVVLTSIFGDLQEELIIYMGGSFAV